MLALLMCVFIASGIYGQDSDKHKSHYEKIEELKNLKLVEYLQLDEQKGIKLIARKKEFTKQLYSLYQVKDSLLDAAKNKTDLKNPEAVKLTNEILSIDKKLVGLKSEYYKSLSDILTAKEILSYLVFEKEFKKELKELMLRRKHSEKEGT